MDSSEKRLAIHVEDHPLDYVDFEGVIPEGSYGAGAVIVWDRGVWQPEDGAEDALERGKLAFDLHGYKLAGRFTLVRMSRREASGEEWLLIKSADGYDRPDRPSDERSIYSGLLVEERAEPHRGHRSLDEELAERQAPRGTVDARRIRPTLCKPMAAPFSDPGWLFELKYDGYRAISEARGGRAFIRYRAGADATALYPEVRRSLELLPCEACVLDGELVVFDGRGHPDFGLLQARGALTRARDVERARRETPVTYMAFDLLELDGWDLRTLPLATRKSLLQRLVPRLGPIKYCEHVEERGEAFFSRVMALDLEGMIAKRADSPYSSMRDTAWRKLRRPTTGEFAIVGYSRSKTRAGHLGALHLAAFDGSAWRYAGKVGSGLSDQMRIELHRLLDSLPARENAFAGARDSAADVWVEPTLVARVRYLEWESGKLLRQPVFLDLVSNADPLSCRVVPKSAPPTPGAAISGARAAPTREVTPSNLDKVFWPAEGYTKGDLLEYYRRISPWLLPYLRDRPLVLTRHPDGIAGKSFFQRDAPLWVPDWLQTETVWSEHGGREIRCFLCNDLDSLLYLVNLGTIGLHLWSSRVPELSFPDWCVLDLDPKGAPWRHVLRCARAIWQLCEAIELPSYLKTSGSSGLHVLIPLGGQCTHQESRSLAAIIARVLEAELSELATTERSLARRGGKVYVDWLQNRHGQLLCAPFSARALPGAPVSMPLRWGELDRCRHSRQYTICSAPRRMRRLGADPCLPVLTDRPNLVVALEKLHNRLRDVPAAEPQ